MEQQTLTQHPQIAGALFQIAVRQAGKLGGKLFNDGFDRPLGNGSPLDLREKILFQACVG